LFFIVTVSIRVGWKTMAEKKPLKKSPTGEVTSQGPVPETGNVYTGKTQAAPPKEKTKAFLARVFIVSILIVIGVLPMILMLFGKIKINDYKDMVLTLASIFGGPLGIVISGYFERGGEK
jgi:general stress protein CsbA